MIDLSPPFVEVLRRLRVPYTEKGGRLEMRCPFHDDRTPSSGVYKSTGRFFCFSCDLSLNAAQFLSRATGEGEDKATKLLEDKYGSIELPKNKQKDFKILKERSRAELRLKDFKLAGISRTGYGKASELLDRVIYLYREEALDDAAFESYMIQWYNTDIAEMERPDVEKSDSDGTAGADFDGRLSKRSSDISGDGEEGIRDSLEGEPADLTDGLSEGSDQGSDLLSFD